ncbi:50S ribosomal protein L20 [Candidatus Phytoplasma citri]
MVKVNLVPARRRRRKKILKLAKGYVGSKSTIYKTAHEQVMRSWQYAYVGRKRNKRDWRSLWIRRINAGCSENGMNYSSFIYGLKLAGVDLNRKILSNLIINKPEMFKFYIELSQKSLLDFKKNKLTKNISKSTLDSTDISKSDLNSDFYALNSQNIKQDFPDTIVQKPVTDNIGGDLKSKNLDIFADNEFTINLSSLQKNEFINFASVSKKK